MNPLNDKEQVLLQRALKALNRTTGMVGQVIEREPTTAQGFRVDAYIEIKTNGQGYRYITEIKRVDRFVTLGNIRNQHKQPDDQLLLVTLRVKTEIAARGPYERNC